MKPFLCPTKSSVFQQVFSHFHIWFFPEVFFFIHLQLFVKSGMSEHSWQNENELGAKHFSDYMNSFGYTVKIYLLFILVRLDKYYIFCLYCLLYMMIDYI